MIVFSAFICDFDVFFSKYAKDHNHRNLITHSIIPSIIVIVLGQVISLFCIFITVSLFDKFLFWIYRLQVTDIKRNLFFSLIMTLVIYLFLIIKL